MKKYAVNTVIVTLIFFFHWSTAILNTFALTHKMLSDTRATHTAQDLSKMPGKTFGRKMTQLPCKEPDSSSSSISPRSYPGI